MYLCVRCSYVSPNYLARSLALFIVSSLWYFVNIMSRRGWGLTSENSCVFAVEIENLPATEFVTVLRGKFRLKARHD